jgi:hypothetical protein
MYLMSLSSYFKYDIKIISRFLGGYDFGTFPCHDIGQKYIILSFNVGQVASLYFELNFVILLHIIIIPYVIPDF